MGVFGVRVIKCDGCKVYEEYENALPNFWATVSRKVFIGGAHFTAHSNYNKDEDQRVSADAIHAEARNNQELLAERMPQLAFCPKCVAARIKEPIQPNRLYENIVEMQIKEKITN